ncbi:hypothetical protein ACHHYP_04953 [Achlya hypogyna]|uniref:Uncharacterized protein n=1 Tax=Achlya hypogyna TaxID=1202772 RepID=A0A1V9YZ90_ACHHY|nr:hypothetical protein ACHHYP_04953 [Achlya hypogyna]
MVLDETPPVQQRKTRPKTAPPRPAAAQSRHDFISSVLAGTPVPLVRMPEVPVLYAKIARPRKSAKMQRPASAASTHQSAHAAVDENGKRRITIRMTHLGMS